MPEQPRIDSYGFGNIEIDGRAYTSDVIIPPTGVRSDWWREEGHTLKPGDLSAVLEVAPVVLVIGQGANGRMPVPQETIAHLERVGIEVVCAATGQAVKIYNERVQRAEAVAAALHLTC